ncbi:MAG: hypothetical protein MJZ89_06800 [Paludibacteraceae bacterium]|nr:hypothetical protein [Paludibacteraceae bacterium]
MKKLFVITAALIVAGGAQAQILDRLLDKAAEKVVNKATGKSSGSNNSKQNVDPIFLSPYYESESEERELFYVDSDVAPVAAGDLKTLLSKMPAIPSGSEIWHPTKATMKNYLTGMRAVSARAVLMQSDAESASQKRYAEGAQARYAAQQKAQQQAVGRAQQAQAYGAKAMEMMSQMPEKDMQHLMELGEKLENMSDKQAEAYLKAHPEEMKFIQKYGAMFGQLGTIPAVEPVDMSAFDTPMSISEDKAIDMINSAPKLSDFVQQEAKKLEDEFNRANGNTQAVSEKAKNFKQHVTNAWSRYLTELVGKVKAELLTMDANNPAVYEDVANLCDYLVDAYEGNLDADMPVLCQSEVTRQIKLNEQEYLVRPENFLSSLSGLELYKRNRETGNLFRFNAGKWTRMPDDFVLDYEGEVVAAENRIITSADGKNKAVVSGTAGFIRLPEGGIVYPIAVEVTGNTIRWYDFKYIEPERPGDMVTWQIVECSRTI